MMRSTHWIIALLVCLLFSCSHDAGTEHGGDNGTLVYTYNTVKQKAPNCSSQTDNGCSIVKFVYPAFKGQDKLNNYIQNRLAMMFPVFNSQLTDLTGIAKRYFTLNRGHLAVDADKPPIYPLNEYAKVTKQDPGLVAMETGGYLLQLDEPFSNISYLNWDTKSDKLILLNDLFKPGYKDQLNKIAEPIFRMKEGLNETDPLAGKYFFKDGKFALNDNFLITPFGLRFLYNEKEIKPREEGFTFIVIPYDQIKTLLQPNTVIAQYLR